MMGSKTGNRETGQTIAKTTLQQITSQKSCRTSSGNLHSRGSASFFEHLTGCERRVTFPDHSMMVRRIVRCVVKNIALNVFSPAAVSHFHRLMNVSGRPLTHRFPEKPQLPIRVPAATPNPATLIESPPRNEITIHQAGRRFVPQPLNRLFQFIGHALVGIQTKDPLRGCLVRRKLFLGRKARPVAVYHASSAACRNFSCPIR